MAATSIGDYALFAGGYTIQAINNVDAYNKSLTRSTPTALSSATCCSAATSIGDYALFGGGGTNTYQTGSIYSKVDAYNTSLTRSTPTALSSARTYLAATSIGNYALFAGGNDGRHTSTTTTYSTVDAYNTSLTRSTPTSLSVGRACLAATSIGDYALFGGGGVNKFQSNYSTVDAYNLYLTKSTPTSLSVSRNNLAAASNSNYALFAGGDDGSNTAYSTVDAYNTSLTRSTTVDLSNSRIYLTATSLKDFAIFSCGYSLSGSPNVDAYNSNLTRRLLQDMTKRYDSAATSVGNYALFGGGILNSSFDIVEAYFFNNIDKIQVFPGTKYKFDNMSSELTSPIWQEIELKASTGYIKYKSITIT